MCATSTSTPKGQPPELIPYVPETEVLERPTSPTSLANQNVAEKGRHMIDNKESVTATARIVVVLLAARETDLVGLWVAVAKSYQKL
ncbi:hypothetical protein V6N13_123714 [Hibiscus sabdariffa]